MKVQIATSDSRQQGTTRLTT